MFVLVLFIELINLRHQTLVEQTGPCNEERHVNILCHDCRICNNLDRRTVDENIVIFFLQFVHHLREHIGKQKFRRVRRKDADRKTIEVLRNVHCD